MPDVAENVGVEEPEVVRQDNPVAMNTAAADRARGSWDSARSRLEELYGVGGEEDADPEETDAEPVAVQPAAEPSRPSSPSSPPSTAGGGLESPPAGSVDPVAEALLRAANSAVPEERDRARRALSVYYSDGNNGAAQAAPVQEEPPAPVKDRGTRVSELYDQLLEGLRTNPLNKTVVKVRMPDPDSDSYDKMKEEIQETFQKDPDNPLVQEQLRLRAELEVERQLREEADAARAEAAKREDAKRTVAAFDGAIERVARVGLNVGVDGATSADWFKKADGSVSEKRIGMFRNNVRALLSDPNEFQSRVNSGVRAGHFAVPNSVTDSVKIAVRLAFEDFTEEFAPYRATPPAPGGSVSTPAKAKEIASGQSAKMPTKAMGPSSASAAAPSQGGQSPIGGDGKPVPRGKWNNFDELVQRAIERNAVE